MGGRLQYCGLMALSAPIWLGTAVKLGWRMLTRCGCEAPAAAEQFIKR